MTRYVVGMYVDGNIYVPVDAETPEEAERLVVAMVAEDAYHQPPRVLVDPERRNSLHDPA